jgi:hypothetical protein
VAKERRFWEILADSRHDNLVLSWLSVVLTVLVIGLSALLVRVVIRPMPVVVVPGAAIAGVYNAGEMPETVMVHFARNFVVDLANYTPASAEKGYLSAARFMSPELLSRFEPVARAQLKQVDTNRISQFFAVDSERVEGKDPLVVGFLLRTPRKEFERRHGRGWWTEPRRFHRTRVQRIHISRNRSRKRRGACPHADQRP